MFSAHPSHTFTKALWPANQKVCPPHNNHPPTHTTHRATILRFQAGPGRASERERSKLKGELEKISLPGLSCSPSLQTSQLSSVRPRLFYSYVSLQPAPASWGRFFSLSFITISKAPAFEFNTCPPTQPSTRGRARGGGQQVGAWRRCWCAKTHTHTQKKRRPCAKISTVKKKLCENTHAHTLLEAATIHPQQRRDGGQRWGCDL